MKRNEMLAVLEQAASRYSVGIEPEMEDWWFHVLKRYKVESLQSFIDDWYRTQRKMPMPCDFETQAFAREIDHEWLGLLAYVNGAPSKQSAITDKVVTAYLGGFTTLGNTPVYGLNKLKETFTQAYRRLALQEDHE